MKKGDIVVVKETYRVTSNIVGYKYLPVAVTYVNDDTFDGWMNFERLSECFLTKNVVYHAESREDAERFVAEIKEKELERIRKVKGE